MSMEKLKAAATKMLLQAYAPYSHFPVGAALLTSEGKIYSGCNIENASYGLTNYAERTAMFTAIAAGERHFAVLLIINSRPKIITPCGACRQVLSEFCPPQMPIYLTTNQTEQLVSTTVADMLPGAFAAEDLHDD